MSPLAAGPGEALHGAAPGCTQQEAAARKQGFLPHSFKSGDCLTKVKPCAVSSLPGPEHPSLLCQWGGDRDVTGVGAVEQLVLGCKRPEIVTPTCCCYHSPPSEQLRNSKYFLSDKGDWGRPELSGCVWTSLKVQTRGQNGQNWYSECWTSGAEWRRCGAGWEPSEMPLPSTFNPPPGWEGGGFYLFFPLPLLQNHCSQGTHLGSQLCSVVGRILRPLAPCCSVPMGRRGVLPSPPHHTQLLSRSSPPVAPDSSPYAFISSSANAFFS